jgi:hypothetical protein
MPGRPTGLRRRSPARHPPADDQPPDDSSHLHTPVRRLWVITFECFRFAKEAPRWLRREAQQDTKGDEATARHAQCEGGGLSGMRANPQWSAGVGTLSSGGSAGGSGEVALNRAARVVDGMHIDVVLLGVQQDVDEDGSRRCDAVDRLVGVYGAGDSGELCGEVDGDRAVLACEWMWAFSMPATGSVGT